jgi:ornithine carbamoyltransferase
MAGVMTRALDVEGLAVLHGQSLLLTQDWSTRDLDALLALASSLEALDRKGVPTDLLPDSLAYALFFDNSTRTKSAWAGAAARLGMQPVIVDGSSTQVSHGETAAETGAMLGMNAHALGIRHDLILGEGNRFMREVKQGIDDYLAATGDRRVVPIVNLQCDVDHPTQTLADLLWLRERLGELAGKKIAVSWAYSPSYAKPLSVPQGPELFTRYGAHVRWPTRGYGLMKAHRGRRRHAAEQRQLHSATMDTRSGRGHRLPKSWGPYDLMFERALGNRRRQDG